MALTSESWAIIGHRHRRNKAWRRDNPNQNMLKYQYQWQTNSHGMAAPMAAASGEEYNNANVAAWQRKKAA